MITAYSTASRGLGSSRFNDNRIRGRKGMELRRLRLAREPLCRHCRDKGNVRAATTPDHKTPLAFGGTDTEDNIQCLCDECHAVKTAGENAAHDGAANHPHWLRPSAVPLTIVCGPPCSGKTTYVAKHAGPYDTVIDLDSIIASLDVSYQHWQGMLTSELLNKAIRVRNEMLGALSRKRGYAAWLIGAAPTEAERNWWQGKLGGTMVLLNPGAAECKRRAEARGTPLAAKGVDKWVVRSQRPWRPKKQTIAVDGWPVGSN